MFVNYWKYQTVVSSTVTLLLGLLTWSLSTTAASAATIFSADFDSIPPSDFLEGSTIPSSVGNGFRVVDGSVDIRNEFRFGLNTGRVNVADLNGLDPSLITSVDTFNLNPGIVELSFELAGSQRGDTNPVTVSLGTLYSEEFILDSDEPFTRFVRTFNLSSLTTANLVFDSRDSGDDRSGLLLDNVVLTSSDTTTPVPENLSPSAILVVGAIAGAWKLYKGNRKSLQK